MYVFWLKRAFLLLAVIACLAAMYASDRFVYGPVRDKLHGWETLALELFGVVAFVLLACVGALSFITLVRMPHPQKPEEEEQRKLGGRDTGRSRETPERIQDIPRTPSETGAAAVWLRRLKRGGFFISSLVFLGIFLCIPWDSWTYSRFVVRYGRARAVGLQIVVGLMAICLVGATLHCVFTGLDYKRRRLRRMDRPS